MEGFSVRLLKVDQGRELLFFFLLAILSSLICLSNLEFGSFSNDEAQHVMVAQNILRTGEFWRLSTGDNVYIGKPPFKMWLTVIPAAVFGESNFSFRLLDGLFGVGTCLLVYLFACRLFSAPRAGVFGVLVLLGSQEYLFDHTVRRAVQDSILVFLFTLAMFIAWLILARLSPRHAEYEGKEHPRSSINLLYATILGLIVGLAAFSKISAAYVVFLVLGIYLLLLRERWVLLRRGLWLGLIALGISVLVPGPYWFSRCLEGREVCEGVLAMGAFSRGINPEHFLGDRWQFLKLLFGGRGVFDPVLVVVVLLWAVLTLYRNRDLRILFLLNWAVVVYALCTAINGKNPWYVASAYPAMALLIGVLVDEVYKKVIFAQESGFYHRRIAMFGLSSFLVYSFSALIFNLYLVTEGIASVPKELPITRLAREIKAKDEPVAGTKILIHGNVRWALREKPYLKALDQQTEIILEPEDFLTQIEEARGGYAILPPGLLFEVWKRRVPAGYLVLPPIDGRMRDLIALTFSNKRNTTFYPLKSVESFSSKDTSLLYGWSGIHPFIGGERIRWSKGSSSALLISGNQLHCAVGARISMFLGRSPKIKSPIVVRPYLNRTPLQEFAVKSRNIHSYSFDVPNSAFRLGENVLELEYDTEEILGEKDKVLLAIKMVESIGALAD